MSATLRLRWVVAAYGRVLVVALVLVGALASFGAWSTYANPPTERVTEDADTQQVGASVQTSALVTGNTSLYERNSRLVDKPAYFLSATPHLTLTTRSAVPAGQAVETGHRLTLHLTAARGGQPFWNSTRLLVAANGTTRNGTFTSRAILNVSNVSQVVGERRAEIGDVGTLSVVLRLTATYETDRYEGSLTASAPLALSDGAYWLSGDLGASERRSRTVARQVRRPPDPVAYLGLAAVALLSLLGAAAIGYVRAEDLDRREIETELAESRYDEWISGGEFPTNTEKRYVRISSLEDLVDVAIDSNKRVLHDAEYDAYAVVDSDVVYYFAVDDVDVDTWLEM
jgi:hypothetical protein